MSELPHEVRETTDKLDAVGNSTAAVGKGFAIGSAALTALSLFAAYKEAVDKLTSEPLIIDVTDPEVIAGIIYRRNVNILILCFNYDSSW